MYNYSNIKPDYSNIKFEALEDKGMSIRGEIKDPWAKKGDIFVYNTARIDMKTIYALDILCKYKNRYRYFHRGFDPVYITFLSKENLLYNIIVTDKSNENGILKLLKINSPAIPEADRLILLFKDDSCLNNIVCNTQFAYCVYPEMKILNKRKK